MFVLCSILPLTMLACAQQEAPASPVSTAAPEVVSTKEAPSAAARPAPAPPGGHVAPPPGATPVARVGVLDDDYEPAIVSAKVGEFIEWYHRGLRLHTITALDFSWDSGAFTAGDTFYMSFHQPGTYQYFCTEHPWMRGIVVVTE